MPTADERRQLRNIERALERAVEKAVVDVTREVHRELAQRSPVQTGNLRANWRPSAGAPAEAVRPPVGQLGALAGEAATAAGLADVDRFRLRDGSTYIVNEVGYAQSVTLDRDPDFVEGAIRSAIAAAERGGLTKKG